MNLLDLDIFLNMSLPQTPLDIDQISMCIQHEFNHCGCWTIVMRDAVENTETDLYLTNNTFFFHK